MSDFETLVEVYQVTEYRDGCVYRTASLGEHWVDFEDPPPEGLHYAPLSTPRAMELNDQGVMTLRRKRKESA